MLPVCDRDRIQHHKRKPYLQVNDQIVSVLHEALRCVPGGYLARASAGDLKYLLAFFEPQDAVAWCLLVSWQQRRLYAMIY